MKFQTLLFVTIGQVLISVSAVHGAFEPKPRLAHLESTGIKVSVARQRNEDRLEMPSESPAPSPSPSSLPTPAPSSTNGPTPGPSYAPSESPEPSPSPSSSPSRSPTVSPSDVPSDVPSDPPSRLPSQSPSQLPSDTPSLSLSPSKAPSLSAAPSALPSRSPSQMPSDKPSVFPSDLPSMSPAPSASPTTGLPSVVPSDIPTMMPSVSPSSHAPSSTPSDMPSDTPTVYSSVQSTILSVTIDLHDTLGPELRAIWEEQTLQFIETQLETEMPPMDGTSIEILSLKMTEQTAIPKRRLLRDGDGRELHASGLRIRFNVTGEVKPGNPPPGFVFANEVGRPFRENYAMYIYRLHSVHEVFQNLVNRTDTNPDALSGSNGAASSKQSAGVVAGIVIASVGSVALAVFAGLYAIRSRRSDESVAGKPMIDVYQIDQVDSHSTMMTPYNEADRLSPRSLESGKQFSAGSRYSRGSSKGSKDFTANPKSLLDDMIGKNDSEEDIRSDDNSDLGLKLTGAVLGAHGGVRNNYRAGSDPPAVEVQHGMAPHTGSLCYSDDESSACSSTPRSVQLTPHSATQATTPSSVFSGLGHLGARPMEFAEQLQYQADNASITSSTLDASVKRTGLYDVFAPSGPLGIVVDTTKDGPVVHSMKPTSPLLGLISGGDLIVGLDDMDTRSMTAATLTRLMAKRSHQAERKITLLAIDANSIA